MSIEATKKQLWRIGQLYPTIAGMLTKKVGDKTVGQLWAEQLSKCDASRLEELVDEICELRRLPVPEGEMQDRLPYFIKREVDQRYHRDREAWLQHCRIEEGKRIKEARKNAIAATIQSVPPEPTAHERKKAAVEQLIKAEESPL